jgi:uncharacterized protein YaaW (UPF0174 family)
MKLEIEVTEEEIKSAIERKVRTAIADQTSSYGTDQYIQKSVKEYWQKAVDDMVVEYLSNSEAIKKRIADNVEKKLKAKINAILSQAGKGV